MSQINDLSLIAQVLVFHNRRAFDTLVKKYQSPVRRFFLNLTLGNEALSSDLAQETFVKAYMNLATFKNISSFSTWLYRIAYNVFYDEMRKNKLMNETDFSQVNISSPDKSKYSGLRMDVYKALRNLKEEERLCVTLQIIEDLPIEKIVEITGFRPGTVKSHISRGKYKLVEYLKKNGYDRR